MSEFAIEVEGGSSVRLPTAGKYCDRDIVVTATGGGEPIYFTPNGVGYFENTILDCKKITSGAWLGADNLKVLELTEWNPTSTTDLKSVNNAQLSDPFQSASLETLLLPKLQYSGHYWIRNAKGLKTVQLGSIGYPINGLGDYAFWNCTQNDLTITVYVADDATLPVSKSPWGATNATIIYRSATTGEVIEV